MVIEENIQQILWKKPKDKNYIYMSEYLFFLMFCWKITTQQYEIQTELIPSWLRLNSEKFENIMQSNNRKNFTAFLQTCILILW